MDKNVMLISDGGGFMTEALANNLKKIAGFSITKATPTMEDIKELRKMDLYGAIIGKAYYTGAIDLRKALEVAR